MPNAPSRSRTSWCGCPYRFLAPTEITPKRGRTTLKTSSTDEFLSVVRPRFAVISVGAKNRYGHPHQEVLDRLGAFGIKIFRTDQDGDIELKSDGAAFTISPR